MRFLAFLALLSGVSLANIVIVDGEMEFEGIGIYATQKEPTLNATGIGFDATYKKRFDKVVWAGFGGTIALPLHENKNDLERGAPTLLGVERSKEKGSGFYSINRLFVTIDDGEHSFKIGRFLIDSPMTQDQKGRRFAPNSFEAIAYKYHTGKRIDLHAGFLQAFSGHTSASRTSETTHKGAFSSVDDALFAERFSTSNGKIKDSGMFMLGAEFKHSNVESQGWFYSLPTLDVNSSKEGQFSAYYADITYNLKSKDNGIGLGVQYTGATATKNFKDLSHAVVGAKVEGRFADRFALDLSHNSVSGKGGLIELFGSRPTYVSGVETSIADLRKGSASRVGAHYKGDVFGLDLAYLQQKSKVQPADATIKINTLEAIASYTVTKEFKNELRYIKSTKDNKSSLLLYRASVKF